ncbi:hypothetical protein O181_036501 [Austropuccinia psidii MF-1]|uniref:Uncharacterized protein n=1 Tax=Austropuccinia psidii MF-1 TaxID=1389203 RepID=A0A9Q3D4J2_9BASI|nr:hypothetical protein [Austropuccinia psidii MF-1]
MFPVHLRNQPEDREEIFRTEDKGLKTIVDGKALRERISRLTFTFQFRKNLKPEVWKDMDQFLKLHQLLKYSFQRSMNERFNLASHWAEHGAAFQKICIEEIPFKDIMVITKGCNPNTKLKLLDERESRIRENQATIQAIEDELNHMEKTLITLGS